MFAEQPPGLGSLWYGTAPVSGCSQSALRAGGWSWAMSLEQSHEDVQQCRPTGPESVSTTVLGRWMRRGGKALPENNFHSNDGNAVTQVKGIDLRHETPLAVSPETSSPPAPSPLVLPALVCQAFFWGKADEQRCLSLLQLLSKQCNSPSHQLESLLTAAIKQLN